MARLHCVGFLENVARLIFMGFLAFMAHLLSCSTRLNTAFIHFTLLGSFPSSSFRSAQFKKCPAATM